MASRDERIETYYHQSAWDLAERIVDLEDEAEESRVEYRKVADICADQITKNERLRSAWTSARRRAADEANFGMEALERKEREVSRWRSGHETAEAQLVRERQDNARLRAFAADVRAVRGWAMDGSRGCAMRFLGEIYESLHELETAERARRPFVDRIGRRAARGEFNEAP